LSPPCRWQNSQSIESNQLIAYLGITH
jgi:hypothetical protein